MCKEFYWRDRDGVKPKVKVSLVSMALLDTPSGSKSEANDGI